MPDRHGPLANPDLLFNERIRHLAASAERVLDFGAGRGVNSIDLRPYCGEVHGVDVDTAVLRNPYLSSAQVLDPSEPLPFADDYFDLIVSRYVLEHVEDPATAMSELLRVLKPGGHFVALTPNRNGYVALGARMIPNSLHVLVLKYVQPDKAAEDTFPTVYRLNTKRDLERHLGPLVAVSYHSGDPEYYFGQQWLRRLFSLVHRILPPTLHTAMLVEVRKAG